MSETEKMFVVPSKPGLVLRDPVTRQILPEEGGWVPRNTHWTRRCMHKDCTEVAPPAPAPPTATEKPSEPEGEELAEPATDAPKPKKKRATRKKTPAPPTATEE
jgi:hypothetical protein